MGTTAGCSRKHNLVDDHYLHYTKQFSSDNATAKPRAKDIKISRAKMKAPGSDQDDLEQVLASNEDKMESKKWV